MKNPNRPCLPTLIAALTAIPTAFAAPIINEVMSSNQTTLQDEDEEFVDWIEIFNPDDTAYQLKDHFLSDDESALDRWTFPEIEVPAKSYLIVYASGKNRVDSEAGLLHTNFRINEDGEYLALIDPDGASVISQVTIPALDADQSYSAFEGGSGVNYAISSEPTPDADNATNVVLFSTPGQAFTNSITLELSTPSGGEIRYTLDGKKPTLFNGKTYAGPITIDETVMLNALTSGGPGRTEVFIKVAPELAQRDSELPIVVVDTFGSSVAAKESSMTSMAIGFQDVEAGGRSNMVGLLETNSRGGIRKRGQSSGGFAKFPMRMELWNDENDADDAKEGRDRTLAPLGMPPNSDFILNARFTFDRALIRNTWIMELSNQIGRYATRTRHVELYLNDDGDEVTEDDYFGVYTFMETIKRGEDRVDVPAMAPTDTAPPEITGGYVFKKDKSDAGVWNFNGGGVGLQMVYPTEEGRAERGHQQDFLAGFLDDFENVIDNPDPLEGYPAFLDVGSFIDHHWLNVIPLNVDALRISGYFYKERDNGDEIGKVGAGPIWDYDRSAGSTDGRTTDPERWRGRGGDNGTHFFKASIGEPRWWQDLLEEKEFAQQWVDRYHELRHDVMVTTDYDDTPMPAFSVENIHRIIDHQGALIGEAGDRNFERWGPRTEGLHASQLQLLKDWMETRMEWIDSEMITTPSYTPTEPVQDGPVSVTIKAPPSSLFKPLQVYYTTDGSDPRAFGGEPSATAIKYDGPFEISETTTVIARKFDNAHEISVDGPTGLEWSAKGTLRYFIGEEPASAGNLVVSEVMYHPSNPSGGEVAAGFDDEDAFEFVELLNIGPNTIDLSGARMRGGADFDFAEGTRLASGARMVLVASQAAFAKRYPGVSVGGEFTGGLANSSDRILLRAQDGSVIVEFTYSDAEPWPTEADGDGMALVLNAPNGNPDPAQAASWIAGSVANGTPGTDEDGEGGNGGGNPTGGFADFIANNFSAAQQADASISGPTADADADGLPTFAEYVLGGDPLRSDPSVYPSASVSAFDGETAEVLTFGYSTIAQTEFDVTTEFSSDLKNWTAAGAGRIIVVSNPEGGATVAVFDTEAVDAPGTRYARLRVTQK